MIFYRRNRPYSLGTRQSFYLVILSTAFFNTGTTIKPVGIESHNSTRKYLKNHIFKKWGCHPILVNNKPKLIIPDMARETSIVNTIIDCALDNFILIGNFISLVFKINLFL
jgi:hypothetical protein